MTAGTHSGILWKERQFSGVHKRRVLFCQVASCKNLKRFTETTKHVVIVIYACASNPGHKVSYI